RENSRFIGQRDYNSGMEAATRRGVEQGLQQGLKQGIQQGLKQGIQQAALMMIKNNLPDEQIAKYTGLSEKEIEELRKKQ
ncbi:transposase, partial [bacterium]|nr:transposase [bacterium]